jgi:hypothetical protein
MKYFDISIHMIGGNTITLVKQNWRVVSAIIDFAMYLVDTETVEIKFHEEE